jgi:hypothetical protein
MTNAEIYAEIKTWQAAIGSVVGFVALTLGALLNYHLGRKRDDRMREMEGLAVAFSLYTEIVLIRSELAHLANGIGGWYIREGYHENAVPKFISEMYKLSEPIIYNEVASKMGLIPYKLMYPISRFYVSVERANIYFDRLFAKDGQVLSYGVEWVLEPAVLAIEGIEDTVRQIQVLGNLPATEPPDLTWTKNAIILVDEMRPNYDD